MAEKVTDTEVTWPWARLFEDGALSQLSVQNNISFCLTCLFIVTGGSDQHDLCKIAQFSKAMESRVKKDRAKELATSILTVQADETLETAETERAQKVARTMRERRQEIQMRRNQPYEQQRSEDENEQKSEDEFD